MSVVIIRISDNACIQPSSLSEYHSCKIFKSTIIKLPSINLAFEWIHLQDFEVLIAEPLIKWLPNPTKNFVQKFLAPCYFYFLYCIFMLTQLIGRIISVAKGKQKLRWENGIIFLELGMMLMTAPTVWVSFSSSNL